DDYMTKPFAIEELAARIRVRARLDGQADGVLQAGPLTLDLAGHRATLWGQEISLSAREVALLAALARHPAAHRRRDNPRMGPGGRTPQSHPRPPRATAPGARRAGRVTGGLHCAP
ncbi:MAG: hypothetical protein ACRDKW_00455, partial [Actinomycetota bacterium]